MHSARKGTVPRCAAMRHSTSSFQDDVEAKARRIHLAIAQLIDATCVEQGRHCPRQDLEVE